MMTNSLRDEILHMKEKIEAIEEILTTSVKHIDSREKNFATVEPNLKIVLANQGQTVTFNVGGKRFATTKSTIRKHNASLFTALIDSPHYVEGEDIFIDRSPKLFPFILHYLRGKEDKLKTLTAFQKDSLIEEAKYYELDQLISFLGEYLSVPVVSFEFKNPYIFNGKIIGTNSIIGLENENNEGGICTEDNGWIVFKLKRPAVIKKILVKGFSGDEKNWYPEHGAGGVIEASLSENSDFKKIGKIPYGFGKKVKEVTIEYKDNKARYLRFSNSKFLGISYLKIFTE